MSTSKKRVRCLKCPSRINIDKSIGFVITKRRSIHKQLVTTSHVEYLCLKCARQIHFSLGMFLDK